MREKVTTMGVYHVLNRGVDKRKIFLDKGDHLRFIHDLFEFNDIEPARNVGYYFSAHQKQLAPEGCRQSIDVRRQYMQGKQAPRKLLVDILAFCLMPNHYHLMVRPHSEDGIALFMKKLNAGYAKYFNEKYEREGALFKGRYKLVSIQTNAHFVHISYYIHCNPLDLYAPSWRKREIESANRALHFLEQYRWSSFPDYIGSKNFPSVTQREFLTKFLGSTEQYRKDVVAWLREAEQQFDIPTLE